MALGLPEKNDLDSFSFNTIDEVVAQLEEWGVQASDLHFSAEHGFVNFDARRDVGLIYRKNGFFYFTSGGQELLSQFRERGSLPTRGEFDPFRRDDTRSADVPAHSSDQSGAGVLDITQVSLPSYPDQLSGFDRLHGLQSYGAKHAFEALALSIINGAVDESHWKGRVFEFGCGCGGSAWYFHKVGADLTAVDPSNSIDELVNLQELPDDRVVKQDAFPVMDQMPSQGCDMVTAFMLGPNPGGDFVSRFLGSAQRLVRPGGRILITSDIGTIDTVESRLKGWSYQKVAPHVIVVKITGKESTLAQEGRRFSLDFQNFFKDFGDII